VNPRWRNVVAAAGVLSLIVGASSVLGARDAMVPLTPSADRGLYVRSASVARALALSFTALSADVYWLRTIQHFGGDRITHRRDRPFELLQPLLDLTTSLDPHFVMAYRFGAIFLSEPPPGGPGRPDEAVALLEKGLRADPAKWQYAEDIGFVFLWHRADPKTAALWFRRAAGMPGAPTWLEAVAATTMVGADRKMAAAWLEDMAQHATEPWVRRIAERRLLQLSAMAQIDQLEALVPQFQKKMHRNPTGWEDFAAAGLTRGVPLDPAGAPYVYFPESGRVRLHPQSPLAPLPELPVGAQ
jgi:hypothetical protein